jgi:pimeloyl-ACP methyl ester carboxylesterase
MFPVIVLFLAACSLSTFCQVPAAPVTFSSTVNQISIDHWQMLGPFRIDEGDATPQSVSGDAAAGLERDYLRDFGTSETSVDAQTFAAMSTPKGSVQFDPAAASRQVSASTLSNILDLNPSRRDVGLAVAYTAVVLNSPEDQDIAVAFAVDDNGKAWLNHELLYADANPQHNHIRTFHHFLGVHLRKGDNFLLIKEGDRMDYWGLGVTLFPRDNKILELARDNQVDVILRSAVVDRNQPLELRGDLLPTTQKIQVEIRDAKHDLIEKKELRFKQKMEWDLSELQADHLYYCKVMDGDQSIEEPFFYGDLQPGYDRLADAVSHVATSDSTIKIDLSAPLIRLKHLLEPDSRATEWWDQKVAEMFSETEDNLANLASGDQKFRSASGTHLRAYVSSIDDQTQYYWIHVPATRPDQSKPIPLVIVLPWTPAKNFPFLESANLAELAEDERYSMLGDEFGFAVLQVWGRGMYQGGTAIWKSDVNETLNAVERDYPIDTNRIYLTGTCEGGRQALLLAEWYPGRFAAVGVDGPITTIRRPPSFESLWFQYGSPISQVEKLVDTPVLISHDVNDDDPRIEDSESFAFKAREAGANVTLIRREGGDHFLAPDYVAVKRSFFQFFAGKIRVSSPHQVKANLPLQQFGAGKGPIEDAFGGPVLLVQGTQGTPEQNLAIQGNLEEFEADWRESYFVDCPMKKDSDVTEDDIREKNLILIGDADTNSVVKRIADRLPLHATQRGISIAGKDSDINHLAYVGSQLAYVFVAPNPLNSSRYIVELGMNNWKVIKGWRLHLPRNGVCDYFVFDIQRPAPRLVDLGYFDDASQSVDHN